MTEAPQRQPFATIPVVVIAVAVSVGLLLLAQWHGFHRDELYFIVAGRHLDFGYPDQPPLTPLLSVAATALLGVEPFVVRILPALSAGASIVLVASMARDMGGNGRAQVIAAVTIGLSGLLAAGHLGSTATYELFLWTLALWLVVRLLDGADARLWLAVGAVSGLALQNKQTALVLGAGLVGGLLLARRWDVLRSPWLWIGGLVAALIWAPNLAWQALQGFPQLEMASRIASEAAENRIMLVPELLLLAGPLLFPVLLAGIWHLARAPDAEPWRAIPFAFAVVVVLVLLSGGKSYYASGMFGPLMAAGAIAVTRWLARGRGRLRATAFAIAAATSGLLIAVLSLPVLPPPILARTPISELYPGIGRAGRMAGAGRDRPERRRYVVTGRARDGHRVHRQLRGGERGEVAGRRPAAGVLRPQRLRPLGPAAGVGQDDHPGRALGGRCRRLGLRALRTRRTSGQRHRPREPGAGCGRLGVSRSTRHVGAVVARLRHLD